MDATLLPFGTGPGDTVGPVNVVIGFRAEATSALAFARVSFAPAVTWRLAPAGAIAVIATTATATASAVSGSSFVGPRPAFGCFMRPPPVMGQRSRPDVRTVHVRTYSPFRHPSTRVGSAENPAKPVVHPRPYQPRYGQRAGVSPCMKEASWTSPI